MSRIVVFGAGGRAGRASLEEALRRGHQVTAVVRDPSRHPDLATGDVEVVTGDVLDVDSVASVVKGHDAVISAVYDAGAQQDVFFTGAARALVGGLAEARVPRLIVVGLASLLKTASGVAFMDVPGYPQEYRAFSLAHAAGADELRAATTDLDWLILSPAGDFIHGGERTGRYRAAVVDAASRISYADFAIAVLSEIDAPGHHREHIGVEAG